MSGCGTHESTNHLFLTCNIFITIWHLVHSWVGISSVDPFGIADQFVQFGSLIGRCFKIAAINNALWFSCARVIGKNGTTRFLIIKKALIITSWTKLS